MKTESKIFLSLDMPLNTGSVMCGSGMWNNRLRDSMDRIVYLTRKSWSDYITLMMDALSRDSASLYTLPHSARSSGTPHQQHPLHINSQADCHGTPFHATVFSSNVHRWQLRHVTQQKFTIRSVTSQNLKNTEQVYIGQDSTLTLRLLTIHHVVLLDCFVSQAWAWRAPPWRP